MQSVFSASVYGPIGDYCDDATSVSGIRLQWNMQFSHCLNGASPPSPLESGIVKIPIIYK